MLHPVFGTEAPERVADIVFVHGLNPLGVLSKNHAFTTWGGKDKASDFWPKWLGEDFASIGLSVGVWVLEYDAAALGWLGHAMPLVDRAASVLDIFFAEGIGDKPIVFIAHSLGGLVVKQLLMRSATVGNETERIVAQQTRAIVFLSTPHTGADIASFVTSLGKIMRQTNALKELQANAAPLREQANWYLNQAPKLGIKTRSYFETQKTGGGMVVDQTSADPHVAEASVVPVDADHIGIARIDSRNLPQYRSVKRFVEKSLSKPEINPAHFLSINATDKSTTVATGKVTIAWHDIPLYGDVVNEPNIFRLLDWRSRVTPLIGRELEQSELLDWAETEPGVRVRFMIGPGGAGKSRLAHETAEKLRHCGWTAGQISLDKMYSLPQTSKGLFLIIDYPEAWQREISILLRDLSNEEQILIPVRILLLSRIGMKGWQAVIDEANANSVCDSFEINIRPMPVDTAVEIFDEAARRFARILRRDPLQIERKLIVEWLERDVNVHLLPLFINAAALQLALTGSNELVLSGGQIVNALVTRERSRLDKIGVVCGWMPSLRQAVSRIMAMAVAAGGLDVETIALLSTEGNIGLERIPSYDELKSHGLIQGERIVALSPDIVAAELLYQVCEDRPKVAAEWLWLSLSSSSSLSDPTRMGVDVDRLGRIAYDINLLHGPEGFKRFAETWLAQTIQGKLERARKWQDLLEDSRLPQGILPLAITVGKTLLGDADLPLTRQAEICASLSGHLLHMNETAEAVAQGQKAVDIYVRLEQSGLPFDIQDAAKSLVNLANCLLEENEIPRALILSHEAVRIYHRLTKGRQTPPNITLDFVRSLRIWSKCLARSERKKDDLRVIRVAVSLCRGLAEKNPVYYEAELASCLNSLSIALDSSAEKKEQIDVLLEAIGICHRLANDSPYRYESDLALYQHNLALLLVDMGESEKAAKVIRGNIQTYRRMVPANPAVYEARLAQAIEKTLDLVGITETPEAVLSAISVWREQVASHPERFAKGLTESIVRIERKLRDVDDVNDVDDVIKALQLARQTVLILLVRGENPDGEIIYAYVAVRADKLETFMESQSTGHFYPEDFGVLVASGVGEPDDETRKMMELQYGFNHEAMRDIPDSEAAKDIIDDLPRSGLAQEPPTNATDQSADESKNNSISDDEPEQ